MSTVNLVGAADLMKVHPQTVRDMIIDGVLPAAQIGRSYVLLVKDVMAYIESEVVRQTAERMRSPGRRGRPPAAPVAPRSTRRLG